MQTSRTRGFTLIELLIVVSILLIVIALAVPNLLRSRNAANEASAVGSLHTLYVAETTYSATFPAIGFTCNLAALANRASPATPNAAGLIDASLGTGQKNGYRFVLDNCSAGPGAGGPNVSFQAHADPLSSDSGTRHFFIDESGIVRFDSKAPANSNSQPL